MPPRTALSLAQQTKLLLEREGERIIQIGANFARQLVGKEATKVTNKATNAVTLYRPPNVSLVPKKPVPKPANAGANLRDSLQPIKWFVPTPHKCAVLASSSRILDGAVESTSRGKMPQFKDAGEVIDFAAGENLTINVLAFTKEQVRELLEQGVDCISGVWSPSEPFCEGNMKTSQENALRRIREMSQVVSEYNAGLPEGAKPVTFKTYLSASFECPETKEVISAQTVYNCCDTLWKIDPNMEIFICDSTGTATEQNIRDLVSCFSPAQRKLLLTHFHTPLENPEVGVQNAVLAHELGIRAFDGSFGLSGHCPYIAKKGYKVANVPTEDVALALLEKGHPIANPSFTFTGTWETLELIASLPSLPAPRSAFYNKFIDMEPQERISELSKLDGQLRQLRWDAFMHQLRDDFPVVTV